MEVLPGTLDLLVLKTLQSMGPLHGWGIGRRIEQISGNQVELNYGTLYPALVRLERQGWITASWGTSENNRRAKYYKLTKAGRRKLEEEKASWRQMAAFVARVLEET
jgi:PadR family transcriptional regulator PadR